MEEIIYTILISILVTITIIFTIKIILKIKKNKEKKQINNTRIEREEKEEKEEDGEVLIVGCGVVGAALAVTLAKDGRKVVVFERDMKEPDRIVGELLQPGGVELLKKLDLIQCVEGIDSPEIEGYVVFREGKEVVLNYPQIKNDFGKKFTPHGRSFHHGRFIQNLRSSVLSQPNIRVIEGTVKDMIYSKENKNKVIGLSYSLPSSSDLLEAYGGAVVVTDGVFSKFRKEITDQKPIVNSSFVGFVLHDISLPYERRGHVILADPSPILCYPISSNAVRVLVDIPHPLPAPTDLISFLRNFSAPQLPPSLRAPFLLELEKTKVRSMPCSRLHAADYDHENVILLGDAFNLRHPLTGGGMTVGFADVIVLRDEFRKKNEKITSKKTIIRSIKKNFMAKRVQHVATINVLAEALYRVFSNYDRGLLPMRDAAFAYFKLGGEAVRGTTSLLSCVNTNPWVLISHFFIVAVYGMIRTLLPFPTPSKIILTIRTLYSSICLLLPLLYFERVFLPHFC